MPTCGGYLAHPRLIPAVFTARRRGRLRAAGGVDGGAPLPDRSRMPPFPSLPVARRAVKMAVHVLAALLGHGALRQLGGVARDTVRSHAELVAENLLLRQQVLVLRRQVARPRITSRDRWWMVVAARVTRTWETALLIVQPATLLRWRGSPNGSPQDRLDLSTPTAASSRRPSWEASTTPTDAQRDPDHATDASSSQKSAVATTGVVSTSSVLKGRITPVCVEGACREGAGIAVRTRTPRPSRPCAARSEWATTYSSRACLRRTPQPGTRASHQWRRCRRRRPASARCARGHRGAPRRGSATAGRQR
jgi:hypothetical protein